MTEKKPCRWGPLIRQASVFARFKNKLRLKKLEWKRFYEQMWGPTHATADSSETKFQEWAADSHHGSEGSTCSNYNSQYFDSEEALELFQQEQTGFEPSLQGYQTSVPMMPSRFQQELQGMCAQQVVGREEFLPMVVGNDSVDHGHPQLPTPWMDHMDSFDYSAPLSVSEYLDVENNTDEYADDTYSELDEQMRIQRNLSSAMSIDSTGHMEMMRDTGDSSSTIPMRPEDCLQWFNKFFEIGPEEALTGPRQASTGRGWRVMVRIVCACRKLSRLLRMRKMEKQLSGLVIVKKRCRENRSQHLSQGQVIVKKRCRENRSQLYKGVRRRNEKWVSEIRVGQTNEKVWLGSYDTEKEAALAFDAGTYHCSAKKCRSFNFPDSPRLLGPVRNLRGLSPNDRKKTIQRLAEDHAKARASAVL